METLEIRTKNITRIYFAENEEKHLLFETYYAYFHICIRITTVYMKYGIGSSAELFQSIIYDTA